MSFEWHRRSLKAFAQGSLTNSKRPECLVMGVYPTHIKKASGAFLIDTEGKKYLDFICGLGSNLIGYANPFVLKAIKDQIESGWLASLPFTTEVEAAEKIKDIFPFVDKLRFFKEGTTACMAAIRIARAKTKRTKVLSDGYHGHTDSFLSLTPPAAGVPIDLNMERFSSLSQINEGIAAVIIEGIQGVAGIHEASDAFFQAIRKLCDAHGAVYIAEDRKSVV